MLQRCSDAWTRRMCTCQSVHSGTLWQKCELNLQTILRKGMTSLWTLKIGIKILKFYTYFYSLIFNKFNVVFMMYTHGPMYQMLVKSWIGLPLSESEKTHSLKCTWSICHPDECFKQYIFNGPFEVFGVYLSCKHLTIPVSPAFFAGGRRRAVIQE